MEPGQAGDHAIPVRNHRGPASSERTAKGDDMDTNTTGLRSNQNPIRHCVHCGRTYDWRRSASASLKMTYCGSLCEAASLGFTIEGLISNGQRVASPARSSTSGASVLHATAA